MAGRVVIEAPRREHVLFVCTANRDRSRTAEDLYRADPRYDVRSAGVAPRAAMCGDFSSQAMTKAQK